MAFSVAPKRPLFVLPSLLLLASSSLALANEVLVGEVTLPQLSVEARTLPPPDPAGIVFFREINRRGNPLANEPDQGRRGTWNRSDVPIDPLLLSPNRAPSATPAPLQSFEGMTRTDGGGATPPDVVGAVGPGHYVQMVNATPVRVFDKSGTILGTFSFGNLWANGQNCRANAGDPIVVYDAAAERWLLSQFHGGNRMCIAISQTPDPLGSYFLYDFAVPEFPDYFKFGVWSDAYYMSSNEGGYRAYAFDRSAMLAGGPATFQRVGSQDNLLLPADPDGAQLPPVGVPGLFYTFKDGSFHGGADRIELFAFSVDWATPANSSFSLVHTIPITPLTYTVCGFFDFNCVRQLGTSMRLDTISEWPMFRFAYREMTSYSVALGSFTIGGGTGNVGGAIRWFELRNEGAGWTLFQEGTIDPSDGHDRWNPSIAMDQRGNIAVGYSVSSDTINPRIAYATRLAGDPPGTMAAEVTLIAGTASQTNANRWGDYSAMTVDPSDDCTFWYTNEYLAAGSTTNWRTRIGSFRIESCLLQQQSIDFPALADRPFNDPPFAVQVSATSLLPVSLSSLTEPVCTALGVEVSLHSVGTCTLLASQAGDAQFAPAEDVERSFAVLQATQSIEFLPLPDQPINAPDFDLNAVASSGLPVSFNSVSPAVCSVSGSSVSLLQIGTCGILATQAGDASFLAADPVLQAFDVQGPGLEILPLALSGAIRGDPYAAQLSASGSGASPPYVFGLDSGSLPAGLVLAASGQIAGTPSRSGESSFVVWAADSTPEGSGGPLVGTRSYQLFVLDPDLFGSGFEQGIFGDGFE